MNRYLLLMLILGLQTSFADETTIYESMQRVRIGPVFLTPEQRHWLDSRRHIADDGQDHDATPDGAPSDAIRRTQPAGYIISSRGQQVQWQGDDFKAVDAANVSATEFPGDVRITRHTNTANAVEDDADGSDETAD